MPSSQQMKDAVTSATTLSPQTTIIVLALIAALTFLTYDGKVNGDAFVSLASVIIGGVLVARGVASGSNQPTNGSQAPPP